MEIESALRDRGGVARWKELDAIGLAGGALTAAVRDRRIVKAHRGCYALPEAAPSDVMATVIRGQPTCVTWCERRGLPLEERPTTTHLAVPTSRALGVPRARPVDGVTLHRIGESGDDFALDHLDAAALCTAPVAQLALIDAALARGVVLPSELGGLRHGDRRRRDWLRKHADARSGSLPETYARVALAEAGLNVVPQARIGAIGCVDLLVEGVVVVEVDGYAYHSGKRSFESDRERDRDLTLAGYSPLRFTYHDVVARMPDMVADVAAVVWRIRGEEGSAGSRRAAAPSWPNASLRTRMNAAARVSDPMWWR